MNARPLLIAALLTLSGGLSVGGCTATLATLKMVRANKAIVAARDDGAESLAPYELTLAESYAAKAREQFADSRHGDAMEMADLARLTAGLAAAKATGKPLVGEGVVDEELTEGTRVMPDAPANTEPSTSDTDPLAEAFEAPEEDEEPAPWEGDAPEGAP